MGARRPPARLDSLAIDGDRISARLRVGDRDHELAYRVAGVPLAPRYEPFLVAALPIAMRAASSLSVPEPVSPRLLDSLPVAQEILATWSDPLDPIEIDAPRGSPEHDRNRGAASFFSGGVDSFYTALRNRDDLAALVHVHGFDVGLDNSQLRERMSRSLRSAAEGLGRPLVEVEANLRETSDSYCGPWFYHGPFLGSVASLLSGTFERILVPATHSYSALAPLGTHPLLDRLWSTEAVEIETDGVTGRTDKVIEISRSDVAMRHLRVCWEEDTDYNCGRCGKCARTIAALHMVGALERCATLPHRVPLRALARTRVRNGIALAAVRGNLEAAERLGAGPRLTGILRRVYRRGYIYLHLKPTEIGPFPRGWRAIGRAERAIRTRVRARRALAARTR